MLAYSQNTVKAFFAMQMAKPFECGYLRAAYAFITVNTSFLPACRHLVQRIAFTISMDSGE
jgi:hypothetical protein